MEHIENHPYAFLDSNNYVIAVNLFDEHDLDLLNSVKEFHNAADYKSCCEHGLIGVGGEFYNGKFYAPKPHPEWVRNEELGAWVAPEGWVEPTIL